MNLFFKTTAALIILIPVYAHAQNEVIFKPDAVICTPYFVDNFKFCKPENKSFSLAPVTTTELLYLQGLPIQSSISFNLFCPSSPKRQTVELKVAETFITLTTTDVTSVNELDTTVALREIDKTKYEFSFKFGFETRFESRCLMEIVSKESFPSKDYLEMVSDFLSQGYEDISSIKEKVEKAQELPAKFSALKTGRNNLDSSISSLNIERNELVKELNNIPESDVEAREELRTTIEIFDSIILDLSSTRDDIDSIAHISTQCQLSDGSVTNADCLASLNKVISEIETSIGTKRTQIEDFNLFIGKEVERLRSRKASLARELSKLQIEI